MSHPEAGRAGRGFRTRWILVSAAGMAVAAAVARPLSYAVGGAVGVWLGDIPAEAAIGAVAGGGVLGGVAFAQWFLLRGRVSWAGRWPVAGALAGANAAAAGFVALKALSLAGQEALGAGAAVVAGLGGFLAAHWLVLRPRMAESGKLALATAGSFLLAAVLTTAAGATLGFEGGGALFALAFGALYGTGTIAALSRLSLIEA